MHGEKSITRVFLDLDMITYNPGLVEKRYGDKAVSIDVLRRYALTCDFEEAVKELSSLVDPFQLALLLLNMYGWLGASL